MRLAFALGLMTTALLVQTTQGAPEIRSADALGPEDRPQIELISQNAQGLTFEISIPTLAMEEISVDDRRFQTLEIPGGGQHFFFDCGHGDSLAFFWFPHAPAGVPGVSAPANRPDQGDIVSAHRSMNHVAFNVAADQIDACVAALRAAGVDCTEVWNHDNSEWGVSREQHDDVFVRSIYFTDPDGISLEIAAWTKELGPHDVSHEPRSAVDA